MKLGTLIKIYSYKVNLSSIFSRSNHHKLYTFDFFSHSCLYLWKVTSKSWRRDTSTYLLVYTICRLSSYSTHTHNKQLEFWWPYTYVPTPSIQSIIELISKWKKNVIDCMQFMFFLFFSIKHHFWSTFVLLAQSNKYRCVFINMAHAKVIRYIFYIYIFIMSPYVIPSALRLIR